MLTLSARSSHRARHRWSVLVLLLPLACRPKAPEPVEPEPPVTPLPALEAEAESIPLDLSPDPLPEGVVAAVDGVPIYEEELRRLAQAGLPSDDPTAQRTEALVQLVERRLLQAKADQMDVHASEEEVDRAIDDVARTNGLTPEQLEHEVAAAGWTWEGYREELVTQIVEFKVLSITGVLGASAKDPAGGAALRARLLGCMRARAEIQIGDRALVLPDNPFAQVARVEGLRFSGDVALPEDELRATALKAAQARVRLCDALTSAELALQERYLERGYLDADVRIPWPAEVTAPVTLDVEVAAGRPHVIGTVSFDQAAAPRAKRLDPKELRKRVAAFVVEGDVATMSAMQAATAEVTRAFEQGGLGPVEASVERKEGKQEVRVDITYRLLGSEV